MHGFERHRRSGRVITTMTGWEADLLRSLHRQVIELIGHDPAAPERDPLEALLDFDGPTEEPDDPALARLLPSAHRSDPEAAAEFRRYTEPALRDSKARAAADVIETLEAAGLPPLLTDDDLVIDVELDPAQAQVWLRALNDVRLALGTRLGIEQDDDDLWDALPDDDPRLPAYDVYQWLSVLQGSLVDAVMS
ncbi:DUF2017 domain-containing protein [Nocardioides sp.]|uniref:DUF2017 domain-containing protein n=1 Tax=Nocardioides sp. TaxID=35761 RepID=UPI0035140E5E